MFVAVECQVGGLVGILKPSVTSAASGWAEPVQRSSHFTWSSFHPNADRSEISELLLLPSFHRDSRQVTNSKVCVYTNEKR